MATATELSFHAAANIFPLDDENLDDLVTDIREHGQLVAIELCDGKILDGRRRYMACRRAKVEPHFCDVAPDDPVSYVLSLNLHRRQLTTTQRALVAGRAKEMYIAQAKERQRQSGGDHRNKKAVVANLPQPVDAGKARDAAGKAVGVSGRSVDYASRVLQQGTPALIQACDNDKLSISYAAKLAVLPPNVQDDIVRKAKGRPHTRVEEYTNESVAEPEPGKSRGVGVARANEAIDRLKRIPKNDALRKRGFQIVTDWIRHNK